MPEQFENPEADKLEDETAVDFTPEEEVERVAEQLASKAAKRSQEYDREHNIISK
jgi:hypothetical protein